MLSFIGRIVMVVTIAIADAIADSDISLSGKNEDTLLLITKPIITRMIIIKIKMTETNNSTNSNE